MSCLRSQGGVCPAEATVVTARPLQTRLAAPLSQSVKALGPDHPAQAANDVLSHPLLDKMASLHASLTGASSGTAAGVTKESSTGGTPESTVTTSLSVKEIRDFTDRIGWATATGSWKALADHAEQRRAKIAASVSEAERKAAERDARRTAFLDAYLRAYFDNGRVVKVELQTADLEARVNAYSTPRWGTWIRRISPPSPPSRARWRPRCWYSCDLDGRIARAAREEKDRVEEDLRKDAERLLLKLKLVR